jgi:hypothetical protein
VKGRFWTCTKEQRVKLILLVLLLIAIVFWPFLRWLAASLYQRSPIRIGRMEAAIPRTWLLKEHGAAIVAWKPPMTTLHSPVRSSLRSKP